MVVDTHAHFWKYPDGSKFRYDPPQEPMSAGQLLQRMDEAGVDTVVHVTRSVMGFPCPLSARPLRVPAEVANEGLVAIGNVLAPQRQPLEQPASLGRTVADPILVLIPLVV